MTLKNFFKDNYFEKVEFTKIEIFLLAFFSLLYIPSLSGILFPQSPMLDSEASIYWAGGVSIFVLIFTVILSRKGFTSYTPWLEKLADDKLENDMQLLQLIDQSEKNKKLKDFFKKRYEDELKEKAKKENKRIDEIEIQEEQLFGRKPVNDNEKWYSVFTESLDYEFYETFFKAIYPEWLEEYYQRKKDENGNDLDSYIPELKSGKKIVLKKNPELGVVLSDEEIEIKLKANDNSLYKNILKEMNFFKKDKQSEKKLKKILFKKIKTDLEYYAIMINFRRGLENATIRWLRVYDEFKKAEKNRVEKESVYRDLSADTLEELINSELVKIRENIGKMAIGVGNTNSSTKLDEKLECKDAETEEETIKKIQCKLDNRNEWESSDWRAMGSIYYKWKEAGKKEENGESEESPSFMEKYSNFKLKMKGINVQVDPDPIELAWKKNRTIRAVDRLTEKFGAKEAKKTGKAIIFFGVVFGLIIAVALTNSLDILIETMQLPLDCDNPENHLQGIDCYHSDFFFQSENLTMYHYMLILFLGFFPIAILNYHSGTIFLSSEAAEEITAGNKSLIMVNFVIILLQAIILYFLAASIGDIQSFLSFLIVLVTIDAVWVAIFTWNDMRDNIRDVPVYLEWIIFDVVIGLFAFIYMNNYENLFGNEPPFEPITQSLIFFIIFLTVLVTRAAVDYTYAWKNFWSLFADAE